MIKIDKDSFRHLASDRDDYNRRTDRCRCGSGRRRRDCCHTVVNKRIEVFTPVEIDVRTNNRDARITCFEPEILEFFAPERESDLESGRELGRESAKCRFVVRQLICVDIPISYCVEANVGDSFVDCSPDAEI